MVRIDLITVKGLYGFKNETTIEFGINNLMVGPNNSGKTNIFRIIKFLTNTLSFSNLPSVRYNKTARFPSLKFKIHLSDDEIQDLSNFMIASLVRETSFSGETFENFLLNLKQVHDFLVELKFDDTGTEDIRVQEWKMSNEETGLNIVRLPSGQYITTNRCIVGEPMNFTTAVERLKADKNILPNNLTLNDLLERFINDYTNPIHLPDIIEPQRPSDKLYFIKIKEKFEYSPSDNVSFFPLLGRIIQSKISYLSEQRRIIEQEELLDTEKLHEDGSNLASYLFNLRLNPTKERRVIYEELEKQFSKIMNNEMQFNIICEEKGFLASDQTRKKEIIPKIVFEKKGISFSQDEVGAGVKELLILLTKSKLEKESIILMDEPALHIHPIQLKVAVREIMQNISSSTSQLLIISHSVNMPIVEFLDEKNQLIYVKMKNEMTIISEPKTDDKQILREIFPKLELDLDVEIFFSRCIILVEGDSEIGTLQGLDKRLKKNIGLKDIHIVSLDSNSNLAIYFRILGMFSIQFTCLLDLDSFTRIKEGNLSILLKAVNDVFPRFLKKLGGLDLEGIVRSKEPKWATPLRNASDSLSGDIKKTVEDTILKNSGSIKEYKEATANKLLTEFEKVNIFGIREGTIEDLMISVDSDLYSRVKERSKRMTARNFANQLDEAKLGKLIVPEEVLNKALELSSL